MHMHMHMHMHNKKCYVILVRGKYLIVKYNVFRVDNKFFIAKITGFIGKT